MQAETVFLECEDIFVKYDGKCAWLGGNNANDISRACFLLAYNLQSGIQKFEIRQKRQFKHCGAMIDVSRNGVMKLNAIKKFLQYMPEAIVAVGGGSAIDSSKAIREFALRINNYGKPNSNKYAK